MSTPFPQAVPEIPVADVDQAALYYTRSLGFQFDWGNNEGGIGGISQGDCRMFLTNTAFRQNYGTTGPATIWINLSSKAEVDELHRRWQQGGARFVSGPEDKPWGLREFTAVDLDGNQLRVFYDFASAQDGESV